MEDDTQNSKRLFFRIFAFKCSVCNNPIVPKEGQTKAPRIRALDRDFHPQCFKCEVNLSCLIIIVKPINVFNFVPRRTVTRCWTPA